MEQNSEVLTASASVLDGTVKETIIVLLNQINRPGIAKLQEYLLATDFFTAPCSTQFHLAGLGGLSEHSLNVYRLLAKKCEHLAPEIPKESIIICGLCHDLCKINFYSTEKKWRKDAHNQWESYDAYVVKDQFPFGHGEKSVSILQNFIGLTDEEKLAIRWHMAAFDAGIHFNYPNGFPYREAVKRSPLVTLLFTADYEASNILENE